MSRQSRCVFIGNIAYDATEDQLIEVFKEVGPVVNFRLVYDRDTRKPRGYGFCEYSDPDSAQSAMRNLNGREVNGRPLRVDFADNDRINMPGEGEYYGDRDFDKGRRRDGGGRGDARDRDFRDRDRGGRDRGDRDRGRDDRPADRRPADRGVASMMGQPIILPGGPPPPQNQPPMGRPMNAPGQQFPMEQQPPHAQGLPMDPITAALSQIPKNQLYDALAQMKGLTVTNPDLAKQIFHQIPTMALLMLHLEYIFGLVKQAPQPITLEGGMGAPAPSMMGAPPMAPPPMVAQPPPMPQGQPPMMGQPPPMHAMAPTQPTPIGMIPQGQPPMMGQPPPMRPPPVMPQGPPPMHGGMPQGPPPPMHPGGIPQGPPPPMHMAAAPPPPTPADQITQMLKSMTQQQIQDLLRLTPQQLEALNPTQRAQVQAIQSHMATLASSFLPKQM